MRVCWNVRRRPRRAISGTRSFEVAPLEGDRAPIDGMVADDGVEQRRLARPVGTHESDDGPLGDGQGDVVVGNDAAERLGDTLDFEERDHRLSPSETGAARGSTPALSPHFPG